VRKSREIAANLDEEISFPCPSVSIAVQWRPAVGGGGFGGISSFGMKDQAQPFVEAIDIAVA
jgi:hypothetical protein